MDNSNARVWIDELEFNDGTKFSFNPNDIVIFVGANNVGKSKTLKEIKERMSDSPSAPINSIMIKNISMKNNFTRDNLMIYLHNNFEKDKSGNYSLLTDDGAVHHIVSSVIDHFEQNINSFYFAFYYMLSTENRLTITREIKYAGMGDRSSLKIYSKLKSSEQCLIKLNSFLTFSFKKCVDVFDFCDGNYYSSCYKIGNMKQIEETINSKIRDASQKLSELDNLQDQGDGIRSAIGILSSLIVNDQSVFLIDEPEAFLHPPQARLLGKEIVELSKDKQCFISTHNIDLIRGLLEIKSTRIKIIKINREENTNEFHLLDNESISEIAKDKNLKYSNILNGLFYSRVVLCEDESDCKFYSTILESIDTDVYQNTLFCAVGGKDQFKLIIPLLKQLNIDFFVLADIDLINDKDKLKQLVNSLGEHEYDLIKDSHKKFLDEFKSHMYDNVKKQTEVKSEILGYFNDETYMTDENIKKITGLMKEISKFKIFKSGGERVIPAGPCKISYNQIKQFLINHNIFILPCGEVERFCTEIEGHGDNFVNELFTKYPDMDNPIYDDAKQFLKSVFKI